MSKTVLFFVTVAMLSLLVCVSKNTPSATLAEDGAASNLQAQLQPLLQYQGRLCDSAGDPVADGAYSLALRLYNMPAGGTALWSEIETVDVIDGIFSTVLGDSVALDQRIFSGQALWLGISVGDDAEATPRQQIVPVAYALSLLPGATINAASSDAALTLTNSSGQALRVQGAALFDGPLTTAQVSYSSPRTHYFIVGSEAFVPGSNVDYFNTYGNGGAYIISGSGALVAPLHLPDGAVVTEFRVFFNDISSSDMTVYLDRQYITGGGFAAMAQVSSSGSGGYSNIATTAISGPVIDNTSFSYLVYAYSNAWDDNRLRIKAARITYTLDEAP